MTWIFFESMQGTHFWDSFLRATFNKFDHNFASIVFKFTHGKRQSCVSILIADFSQVHSVLRALQVLFQGLIWSYLVCFIAKDSYKIENKLFIFVKFELSELGRETPWDMTWACGRSMTYATTIVLNVAERGAMRRRLPIRNLCLLGSSYTVK